MNKKVKKKWLKALRSGAYVQGKGRLIATNHNKEDSFCCLGVLCDIHAYETNNVWHTKKVRSLLESYLVTEYQDEFFGLPERVREWAKLTPNQMSKLIDMNDEKDFTFDQIAAYISRNL